MKTNTVDGKNFLDLIFLNGNAQIIIYIHLGNALFYIVLMGIKYC